ncbi:unannotated protein [freshwater metagenome]|uniref:Unannotated protein n=1 Tax=freshwater metagenome TaxID=449393 RepID=A0A6J5YC01_9ZZZZ
MGCPLAAGATQRTAALESPRSATTEPGASGADSGVSDVVAAAPRPSRFTATTRTVYVVPAINPVSVHSFALVPVTTTEHVAATESPEVVAVTMYDRTVAPLAEAGLHLTVAVVAV